MFAATELIDVEVAYALPQRQWLVPLRLPKGSRVDQAIAAAAIPNLPAVLAGNIGIFMQPTTLDSVLRSGDRVEIYRPLFADPKDARRTRAKGFQRGRLPSSAQ